MHEKMEGTERERWKTLDDGRGHPRHKKPPVALEGGKHGTRNFLHPPKREVVCRMCNNKKYRRLGEPIQGGAPRNNATRSKLLHPAQGKTRRF
mmetsp:Transcript_9763/g.59342  ORF Transcript_9763/g.59342 Transcript_9763/m.59342 type:complete len:93 (-) Transcript_9763:3262-3540(-)